MDKDCAICGQTFYASPSEVRRGNGKYCSAECYRKSRIGRKMPEATRIKLQQSMKQSLARKRVPAVERFEKYFRKDEGWWLWTGGLLHIGYGAFTAEDRKSVRAHRFSYEIYIGEIPKGLTLDHLCRVRSCVNPSHLEPVTIKENLMRSSNFVAINAKKTHCKNGHEFTEGSFYLSKKGSRDCKQCKSDGVQAREASKT